MANATKSYKTYDYICRYESFPYYYDETNNRYYYGLTSWLSTNVSYTLYEVKAGDSYDSIALNFYGCALFWWIICDYNRVMDCLVPLEIGTRLKLPSISAISFLDS